MSPVPLILLHTPKWYMLGRPDALTTTIATGLNGMHASDMHYMTDSAEAYESREAGLESLDGLKLNMWRAVVFAAGGLKLGFRSDGNTQVEFKGLGTNWCRFCLRLGDETMNELAFGRRRRTTKKSSHKFPVKMVCIMPFFSL